MNPTAPRDRVTDRSAPPQSRDRNPRVGKILHMTTFVFLTRMRAIVLAIAVLVALNGCLITETPPSTDQPCDPALIGDWGLVKGEGILGSRTRASADSDFTADDERRLRIDARCRAHLPSKFEPREVQLRVFRADGHRYLGLELIDVAVLLTGEKGRQDFAKDRAGEKHPNAVSLLRYQAGPESLSIDGGNMDQLKRMVQEREAKTPDWLMGDAKQIRQQLRAHPELFSLPDGDTVYRFKRISPAVR